MENKKLSIIITIIIIAFAIWWYIIREEPVLDASLSLPSEVMLDTPVTMTVTATNNHTKVIILDSIDISDSFLAGFQVISVDPEPTETFHLELFDMRSWSFSQSVQPGESLPVNFELKPIGEGRFMGDVDVCNPNQDFITLYADIIVKSEL